MLLEKVAFELVGEVVPEVEFELVVLVAVVVLEDVLFCACMLVVLLEVWLLFVA